MLEKFLRMSGVSEKQLTRESQRLERGGLDFCIMIERMLEDIKIHELRDVIEIWNLCTEDQWERYHSMELEDLREQLLLKEALKRLRTKYKEVRNYGRQKNRNKGNQEGIE